MLMMARIVQGSPIQVWHCIISQESIPFASSAELLLSDSGCWCCCTPDSYLAIVAYLCIPANSLYIFSTLHPMSSSSKAQQELSGHYPRAGTLPGAADALRAGAQRKHSTWALQSLGTLTARPPRPALINTCYEEETIQYPVVVMVARQHKQSSFNNENKH